MTSATKIHLDSPERRIPVIEARLKPPETWGRPATPCRDPPNHNSGIMLRRVPRARRSSGLPVPSQASPPSALRRLDTATNRPAFQNPLPWWEGRARENPRGRPSQPISARGRRRRHHPGHPRAVDSPPQEGGLRASGVGRRKSHWVPPVHAVSRLPVRCPTHTQANRTTDLPPVRVSNSVWCPRNCNRGMVEAKGRKLSCRFRFLSVAQPFDCWADPCRESAKD
jgi:hypothetical protein